MRSSAILPPAFFISSARVFRRDTGLQSGLVPGVPQIELRPKKHTRGMWCSGITPAQHAGGPELKPQHVHFYWPSQTRISPRHAAVQGISAVVSWNYIRLRNMIAQHTDHAGSPCTHLRVQIVRIDLEALEHHIHLGSRVPHRVY